MASEKTKNDTIVKEKVVNIQEAKEVLTTKKEKKTNTAYLFGKAFGERLRTDKIFLLSFFITIVFLGNLAYGKLRNSEGAYPGFVNRIMDNDKTDEESNQPSAAVNEVLDISDYVGVYSKEVTLNSEIVLSNSCKLDSYKIVYQIKKDKTINKYFFNDCLGVVKMSSDKLDYVTSGGTKYIGTEKQHFLFSGTKMQEVAGDTFKLDDNISSLKEKINVSDLNLVFYDGSIVLLSSNNLIQIRANNVLFNLNDKYSSVGGDLKQRVYKIDDDNYRFIVFSNDEKVHCYEESEEDALVYKIYSIKYNNEENVFGEAKELASRSKTDGCTNWDKDLDILKGKNS